MGKVTRTRFDVEALDEADPFEVDDQLIHLYKHQGMDLCDVYEVWMDNRFSIPVTRTGRQTGSWSAKSQAIFCWSR